MTPQELSDLMDEYAPKIKKMLEDLSIKGIELGADIFNQTRETESGKKYTYGVTLELTFKTDAISLTKSY
jgi:hypothetical protein